MNKYLKIVKISPSISTANIGDYIISDYCDKIFEELFGEYLSVVVPSREKLSRVANQAIATSNYSFICGTNLLASDIKKYRQWNIDKLMALKIVLSKIPRRKWFHSQLIKENLNKIHIILLGVGWLDYQGEVTNYSKKVYHSLLDKSLIHSVRDSYTEKKLKEIGIKNVLNTACPTMWRLTEEFCKSIPVCKSDTVVTTITDYRKNPERDQNMLEILLSSYKNVTLWLQSFEDIQYLKELGFYDRVKILPPSLQAYDVFLQTHDTDYVGTRLHGGIRALNNSKRSFIIAVDNRALEIAKDTNLPVVKSEDVHSQLASLISSDYTTRITLPMDNILKWKKQFKMGEVE